MLPSSSFQQNPTAFQRRRSGIRSLSLQFCSFAVALVLPAVALAVDPDNGGPPPLSVEDAVKVALQHNQSIKVDFFSKGIARANLLTALGQFDPSIKGQRSVEEDDAAIAPTATNPLIAEQSNRVDTYSLSLEGTTPWGLNFSVGGQATNSRGTFNNFADSYATFGGVAITQPLLRGFGFGANLYNVRVAKADRSISDWDYRQTVITTVTNVVLAYSNLLAAQDRLRIAQRSHDLAAGFLAENEKRASIGQSAQSDVITAKARAAAQDDSIIAASRVVKDSENRLRQLLGDTDFALDRPALKVVPFEQPQIEVNPADDLKKAFVLRPDYQAAKLGLVKIRANDALARNQLLPQVDFVGSYGYNGLDRNFSASRRMIADRDNRSYSAGVVVNIPLTFAAGRGRARAARLQSQQADANLVLLEQNIALAVANAAGQIETTRQRVAADHNAFTLAEQALVAEQKKFRAGTSSTIYVLNQQDSLVNADSRLSNALADQRNAFANYESVLGTILDRYHVTLAENEAK